ncbi:hypothetical protein Golax_001041 [Gossypium laxum]|uniref:Uncharacterized protein n=1 Tax=Gossypium laxum TaxID=34288 RepID=A0A7J9AXD5_9ROSI|nr:hypothetical protein [Gossypium laxum]
MVKNLRFLPLVSDGLVQKNKSSNENYWTVHEANQKNSIPKIEWMIRLMQETSPALQEFVQQNNMKVPNYLPNMFGPIHSHHEAEEKGREDREDSEDGEGEEKGDEMDFVEKDD